MSRAEFQKAIDAAPIVLVDFGATWCPPCKKMEPIIKNVVANLPGKFNLFKVDAGKDEAILSTYKVVELPAFILFKNGKEVWRKSGMVDEKELETVIKNQ